MILKHDVFIWDRSDSCESYEMSDISSKNNPLMLICFPSLSPNFIYSQIRRFCLILCSNSNQSINRFCSNICLFQFKAYELQFSMMLLVIFFMYSRIYVQTISHFNIHKHTQYPRKKYYCQKSTYTQANFAKQTNKRC